MIQVIHVMLRDEFKKKNSSGKTRAELGHFPLHLRPGFGKHRLCVHGSRVLAAVQQ